MGIGRNTLLGASRNEWLKNHVPKMKFVQKAVKKFMPGTTPDEAIYAAKKLIEHNIPTTFTHLGENTATFDDAEINTRHYLNLLDKIKSEILDIEVSLKLTNIGFDLSFENTIDFFSKITEKAKILNNNVFIDIEDSSYVDKTIEFYKKIKENYDNIGLCLQAYLYRTLDDIKDMIDIHPWIRLVKGAYKEPESIAFKKMEDVNNNYILISNYLLKNAVAKNIRTAFATHDLQIQEQVKIEAQKLNLEKNKVEFQMLFGIKTAEQQRLTSEGYKVRTLISYGEQWYSWYMRRLAERPANIGFVLKNIFN